MDFYKRVGLVCGQIPYGKVATYGQIALLCQKPQNARQVGYALNKKGAGGEYAHRVVNGRGILSGAGAFGEGGEQGRRLMAEGVKVFGGNSKEKGNEQWVELEEYGWKTAMEDALWFVDQFKRLEI